MIIYQISDAIRIWSIQISDEPSNRQISIRSNYLSDWSDGSSDIRMDPWSVIGLSGWFIIIRRMSFTFFVCLRRKRADIRSIRSDPINPMAHHRLKKRPDWGQSGQSGQFDLIRSIRWLITGYPRLSAAWTFWARWSRHVIIRLTDWSVSSGSHL